VVDIEEKSGLSLWGWEGYYTELSAEQTSLMFVAQNRVCVGEGAGRLEQNELIVAGFIAARLTGDVLHINNVAVRQNLRRQGIGAALFDMAIKEGRRLGAQQTQLEVRAANTSAQDFYARFGLVAVGRRPKYYHSPVDDAILMSAVLSL
jgi:ribosomal-protein-alanine N-acetyltransferase